MKYISVIRPTDIFLIGPFTSDTQRVHYMKTGHTPPQFGDLDQWDIVDLTETFSLRIEKPSNVVIISALESQLMQKVGDQISSPLPLNVSIPVDGIEIPQTTIITICELLTMQYVSFRNERESTPKDNVNRIRSLDNFISKTYNILIELIDRMKIYNLPVSTHQMVTTGKTEEGMYMHVATQEK